MKIQAMFSTAGALSPLEGFHYSEIENVTLLLRVKKS